MLAERATVNLVAAGTDRPADETVRIEALRGRGVAVPYGGGPVHLVRLLMGGRYALILAESWDVAELALPHARRYQPQAAFAVDTIDLHFLRDTRAGDLVGAQDPGQVRSMARELSTYQRADIRVFITEVERELYEGFPDSRRDHNAVVPIVVEAASLPRRPRRGDVVFVGGLWHPPNMDGVFWFCSEVWPRVRACVPEARFRVIGSNAWNLPIDTSALADRPGVVVEGFLADLDTVYAEASAVVAPLRFGAGMKGKVCEAMAAGVPVVTTTIGAEGIQALVGRDLLVADDPEAIAAAVVSLLADDRLAASVGAAGAEAIRAQCSAEIVRPVVHDLLLGLDSSNGPEDARRSVRQIPRAAAAASWRFNRRLQARFQQRAT